MTERMNMMRIGVPEKKPESLTFDPERDITPGDWKRMQEALDVLRNDNDNDDDDRWSLATALICNMRLLDPARKLKITPEEWSQIMAEVDEHYEDEDWFSYIAMKAHIKCIDPTRVIPSDKDIDAVAKGIREQISDYPGLAHALFGAFASMVGSQNKKALIPTPVQWVEMRADLRTFREKHMGAELGMHAACMRILDPQIDLELTQQDWVDIRNALDLVYRRGEETHRDIGFSQFAVYLSVLVAKDVRLTSAGIEIIPSTIVRTPSEKVPGSPDALEIPPL